MEEADIHEIHAVIYNGTVRTVHIADEYETFLFGCEFNTEGQISQQQFQYYGDRVLIPPLTT